MVGRTGAALEEALHQIWLEAVETHLPLPTELEMSKRLGASRPMVREALIALEAQGLVSRRAHQGTFANVAATDVGFRIDQSYELTSMLEAAGYEVAVDVIEAGWSELTVEEAEDLECEPGADCLRVIKRWRANGKALICAEDVVPARRRDVALPDDYSIFETTKILRNVGAEWESAKLTALLPTPPWQTHLEMAAPEPVIAITVVGVSLHGERLYRARELHVPGGPDYGMVRRATQQL